MKEGIGRRIKMIRSYYGLTQTELADKINNSQRNISRYELEMNQPDINFLFELMDKLSISPQWFLSGEGDMIQKNFTPVHNTELVKILHVIESNRILQAILYAMLVDNPDEQKLNEQIELLKTIIRN